MAVLGTEIHRQAGKPRLWRTNTARSTRRCKEEYELLESGALDLPEGWGAVTDLAPIQLLRGAAVKPEAFLMSIALITGCVPERDEPPMAPEPIGPRATEPHFLARFSRLRRSAPLSCAAIDPIPVLRHCERDILLREPGYALSRGRGCAQRRYCKRRLRQHRTGSRRWLVQERRCSLGVGDTVRGRPKLHILPRMPNPGFLELHEVTQTLIEDITGCTELGTELDLLESVEPGCRPY